MSKTIKKISWQSISETIKNLNLDIYKLINPISEKLKASKQDYVYQVTVPYGEELLIDGKALILKEDNKFELLNNYNNEPFVWKKFFEDCKQTTDYPLSIVIKNYVEIYGKNKSFENNVIDYNYPIRIINTGECFGVWGIVDIISSTNPAPISGWYGVSGRSCFVHILKSMTTSRPNANYCREILKIFNKTTTDFKFEEELKLLLTKFDAYTKETTEFIVLPNNYIFIENKDIALLKTLKTKFQNYLLNIAWQSVEGYRNIWWHFSKIYEKYNTVKHIYQASIINHLNEVMSGKGFGIRPVNKKDGVFYSLQMELIKLFYQKKILKYYFPGILIYSKISDEHFLIVSLNSPAFPSTIHSALGQTRRAELRRRIIDCIPPGKESPFNEKMEFYNPKPENYEHLFKKTKEMVDNYLKEIFHKLILEAKIHDFPLEDINVYLPDNINFITLIKS